MELTNLELKHIANCLVIGLDIRQEVLSLYGGYTVYSLYLKNVMDGELDFIGVALDSASVSELSRYVWEKYYPAYHAKWIDSTYRYCLTNHPNDLVTIDAIKTAIRKRIVMPVYEYVDLKNIGGQLINEYNQFKPFLSDLLSVLPDVQQVTQDAIDNDDTVRIVHEMREFKWFVFRFCNQITADEYGKVDSLLKTMNRYELIEAARYTIKLVNSIIQEFKAIHSEF